MRYKGKLIRAVTINPKNKIRTTTLDLTIVQNARKIRALFQLIKCIGKAASPVYLMSLCFSLLTSCRVFLPVCRVLQKKRKCMYIQRVRTNTLFGQSSGKKRERWWIPCSLELIAEKCNAGLSQSFRLSSSAGESEG